MTQKLKMLVADDSATIRSACHQVVSASSLPFVVVDAEDGRECVEILGRADIDLAFIDVFMPRLSGLEALKSARLAGNKTFVTLMSGRADERCGELARELNAYEFLTKPFRLADIAAVIKTFERARRPMRALVVDDSPTVRSVVRRVLDRSIFRITIEEALDGETALARCRDAQFDLVFMDCNMPGLNGLETLERLREADDETKVVMISGTHDAEREQRALALGAAAFLHKPFYSNVIDALVHELFDLRPPTLTILKSGVFNTFDVNIIGRTIAVTHKDSGHQYQYLWFREPPHLRSTHIRRSDAARAIDPAAFRAQAEKAAVLELKSARLVN